MSNKYDISAYANIEENTLQASLQNSNASEAWQDYTGRGIDLIVADEDLNYTGSGGSMNMHDSLEAHYDSTNDHHATIRSVSWGITSVRDVHFGTSICLASWRGKCYVRSKVPAFYYELKNYVSYSITAGSPADSDPLQRSSNDSQDSHGTVVASVAAGSLYLDTINADNVYTDYNNFQVLGVAPEASLAVRTTYGGGLLTIAPSTDSTWRVDVVNNSYVYHHPGLDSVKGVSPGAQGYTLNFLIRDERLDPIEFYNDHGRNGLGTSVVYSAGNNQGLANNGNSYLEKSISSNIIVGSYYTQTYHSSNLLLSASISSSTNTHFKDFSSGIRIGIGTGVATNTTSGTSVAAPQVSGAIALMLEAEHGLGWRDVKDILANSVRTTNQGGTTLWREMGGNRGMAAATSTITRSGLAISTVERQFGLLSTGWM